MKKSYLRIGAILAIALVGFAAQAAGVDVHALALQNQSFITGMAMLGVMGEIDGSGILAALDKVEAKLVAMSEKAEGEFKTVGKTASDTKTALDAIGVEQRVLADRLLAVEQKATAAPAAAGITSWGEQFVKSARYADFAGGNLAKLRVEVKNSLVGSDTNVAPQRNAGIVAGASLPFSMESLLPSTTTGSNAIEFTKEASFTNNAAEASEGAAKGESALTWSLVNMPVSTVAHWIKISKQLAADAPALAAYVNTRMRYGVNQKVDTQLVVGDGVAPNISGTYDTGNFTAHGIADAALGATLKKFVLIRKVIAALYAAGYPADAIVLNPADWATMEIELLTTAAGQTLVNTSDAGVPRLFGVPVVQAIGMAADTFQVGRFSEAYMVYNREGVVVEMSDSDSDNFTKNLITLRAERRLALATEKPAAVRGGDLTPA
ncbi:phage major capsid protein [Propionivibrio sp.]|uniref:phage major capsid protein n=1 Tax=Propionivibrio sp. TaxID=2212460 RepID=UPI003BF242C4